MGFVIVPWAVPQAVSRINHWDAKRLVDSVVGGAMRRVHSSRDLPWFYPWNVWYVIGQSMWSAHEIYHGPFGMSCGNPSAVPWTVQRVVHIAHKAQPMARFMEYFARLGTNMIHVTCCAAGRIHG